MTFSEWLAARTPAPPAPLLQALESKVDVTTATAVDLMEAGRDLLAESSATAGRVRSSAFGLLLADALVTWACEVALEGDDPDALLRSFLDTEGGSG